MRLFLLGVSHQTAPIDLREKLDFSSRDLGAAVEALASRHTGAESVVLSTCNRSEIYVVSEDADRARAEIVEFLSDYHTLPATAFVPHLFARDDGAVVQHLFRVAAGLDSIVVGEPQVLGQVKHAYQVAADRHCVGPLLTKLFQSSFGVGKRVRSETTLGEGAVSVGFAAVALARKIFGRLEGRRVLVIGAGEISSLAAQHLRSQGVGEIVVTSRTMAHAQALAGTVGGRAVPWAQLSAALGTADIVITATGSQRPILTRDDVAAATSRRRTEPLFIVDVAVPRDVDPSVGDIEQVFLYNVDDLQHLVHENVSKRSAEIARAEAIVSEEVSRFTTWRRSRSVVPTVVALRQRFEAIRKGELQRLNGKLASLSPDARERVEEVTRLMIEKLLLDPTEQLKTLPDQDTQVAYTEMMNRLFRLRDEDGHEVAEPPEAPDAPTHTRARGPRHQ
jgi:glutamyl-tRNA reductase